MKFLLLTRIKFLVRWGKKKEQLLLEFFLILFAFYLSPLVKEARYKNDCINNSNKRILSV